MKHFTVCAVGCSRFISSCKHTGITLKGQYLYVIFSRKRIKKRSERILLVYRHGLRYVRRSSVDNQTSLPIWAQKEQNMVSVSLLFVWTIVYYDQLNSLEYRGVCIMEVSLRMFVILMSHVTVEWQAKQPSAIMCCVGSLTIHLPVYSHPLSFKKS